MARQESPGLEATPARPDGEHGEALAKGASAARPGAQKNGEVPSLEALLAELDREVAQDQERKTHTRFYCKLVEAL